jgi:hypothetical protein
LTDEEADILRADPRVIAVELEPSLRDIDIISMSNMPSEEIQLASESEQLSAAIAEPVPMASYAGQDARTLPYNKSNVVSNTYMNWGLLRCTAGAQTAGWGNDATATINAALTLEATGRNVDVVIIDGGNPNPAHPEFAVNYDGTGGSRMVAYDWHQLDPIVLGRAEVTPYSAADDDHATHVSGTAAGNRQGWARGANIYNLSYSAEPVHMFDYVKAFHQTKAVNPNTGVKNPTIVNNSWGYVIPAANVTAANVTAVTYRGVRTVAPGGGFTSVQLAAWGIMVGNNLPQRSAATDADVVDCIAAGVIIVGAAGNSAWKHDLPSGLDWDNSLEMNTVYPGSTIYYMRGMSPTANDTGLINISVGCVNLGQTEQKSYFSDCGPGVDLYAPGYHVMSSVTPVFSVKATDSRNSSYYLSKDTGTSMASPQVCGVIAAYLELYPRWNQANAKAFILAYAKSDQLTATTGGYADTTDLQGSANLYLSYPRLVPTTGVVEPTPLYGLRPSTGQVFPRQRIFRYGNF